MVGDVLVASASIRRGKLFIRDRRTFDQHVSQMKEGWELQLTLTRRRATRSIQSNRFYWGVVLEALAHYTGYTPEEMHFICKAKFLPKQLAICDGNGEVVEEYVMDGSTRRLNTKEFSDYIERIRDWAGTLDCYIPDAQEWS